MSVARAVRRILALVVALVAVGLAWPASAGAHATLQESRPANEEILSAGPEQVSLRFDEPVTVVGSGLRVFGPDGGRVDRGRAEADGATIGIDVDAAQRGTYTMSWRVLSEDGHNLSGSFVFHVGEKTGAVDIDDSQDPVTSGWGAAGRFLGFAGAMVLLGAAALSCLARTAAAAAWLRRTAAAGAGIAAFAALLVLGFQAARATGRSLPDISSVWDLAWNTRTGKLTLARFGLLVVAALASLAPWRRARWAQLVLAVATAVAVTAAGHAWTSTSRPLAVAADVGHQVFVGAWLGGVVALVVVVQVAEDRVGLVRRFSALSLVAAVGTLATGSVSGFLNVRELGGLTSTGYGQLLVAKVLGFAVLCAFGWLNRQRYIPALERAVRPFVRSLWRSAATATVVLGLTAALVNQPPATASLRKPFETRVVVGDARMQIVVSPARVGLNDLHMYFFDSSGAGGFGVDAVEITAATRDLPPRKLQVTPITASHQSAYGASITSPGPWTFTVTTLSSGTKTVFTVEVPIR